MIGALLAGAALGFGQSAYQNKQNQLAQEDTQAFNSEEAQKNRDFQKEMSSSAYQRQKADLKAANMNPMLAINGGGASTPAGGMASSPARAPAQMDISRGISSAVEATRAQRENDVAESQIGVNDMQKLNIMSNTNLTDARLGVTHAEKELTEEKIRTQKHTTFAESNRGEQMRAQTELERTKNSAMSATLKKVAAESNLGAAQAESELKALPWSQTNKRIQEGASTAKSITDVINPFRVLKQNRELRETDQLIKSGKYGLPTKR